MGSIWDPIKERLLNTVQINLYEYCLFNPFNLRYLGLLSLDSTQSLNLGYLYTNSSLDFNDDFGRFLFEETSR